MGGATPVTANGRLGATEQTRPGGGAAREILGLGGQARLHSTVANTDIRCQATTDRARDHTGVCFSRTRSKEKAARRRLLNSVLMMDQAAINAGFDFRR